MQSGTFFNMESLIVKNVAVLNVFCAKQGDTNTINSPTNAQYGKKTKPAQQKARVIPQSRIC